MTTYYSKADVEQGFCSRGLRIIVNRVDGGLRAHTGDAVGKGAAADTRCRRLMRRLPIVAKSELVGAVGKLSKLHIEMCGGASLQDVGGVFLYDAVELVALLG